MRVLVAECKQEISSFNPVAGRYEDFEINAGDALLDYHRGLNTEMSGAIDHLRQQGVSLVPAAGIRGVTSGGSIAQADYERLVGTFLEAIEAAPRTDAVYLSLHGAMASEEEPDPEGFLLKETRRIVGPDVPVVASFDLHGILTNRILEHADAIVAFHTYPHVDFHRTGDRAARLLLKLVSGGVRPATAVVRIPALVRGDELITETGVFGRIIAHAGALEAGTDAQPPALSAGAFIGNPFTRRSRPVLELLRHNER
jgi:microcystin degradation protein MlrC